MPEVLNVTEDMDCVDFIENLRLEGHNRPVHILNIVSVHGRLAGSFPTTAMSATHVMESLWSHWTTHGFPRYVQFDNGSVFAGAPKPNCVGQVIRMCLQLGITPVFAPPRTHGPQNAIEGYNAKWKRGVWRFHFDSFEEVCEQSAFLGGGPATPKTRLVFPRLLPAAHCLRKAFQTLMKP